MKNQVTETNIKKLIDLFALLYHSYRDWENDKVDIALKVLLNKVGLTEIYGTILYKEKVIKKSKNSKGKQRISLIKPYGELGRVYAKKIIKTKMAYNKETQEKRKKMIESGKFQVDVSAEKVMKVFSDMIFHYETHSEQIALGKLVKSAKLNSRITTVILERKLVIKEGRAKYKLGVPKAELTEALAYEIVREAKGKRNDSEDTEINVKEPVKIQSIDDFYDKNGHLKHDPVLLASLQKEFSYFLSIKYTDVEDKNSICVKANPTERDEKKTFLKEVEPFRSYLERMGIKIKSIQPFGISVVYVNFALFSKEKTPEVSPHLFDGTQTIIATTTIKKRSPNKISNQVISKARIYLYSLHKHFKKQSRSGITSPSKLTYDAGLFPTYAVVVCEMGVIKKDEKGGVLVYKFTKTKAEITDELATELIKKTREYQRIKKEEKLAEKENNDVQNKVKDTIPESTNEAVEHKLAMIYPDVLKDRNLAVSDFPEYIQKLIMTLDSKYIDYNNNPSILERTKLLKHDLKVCDIMKEWIDKHVDPKEKKTPYELKYPTLIANENIMITELPSFFQKKIITLGELYKELIKNHSDAQHERIIKLDNAICDLLNKRVKAKKMSSDFSKDTVKKEFEIEPLCSEPREGIIKNDEKSDDFSIKDALKDDWKMGGTEEEAKLRAIFGKPLQEIIDENKGNIESILPNQLDSLLKGEALIVSELPDIIQKNIKNLKKKCIIFINNPTASEYGIILTLSMAICDYITEWLDEQEPSAMPSTKRGRPANEVTEESFMAKEFKKHDEKISIIRDCYFEIRDDVKILVNKFDKGIADIKEMLSSYSSEHNEVKEFLNAISIQKSENMALLTELKHIFLKEFDRGKKDIAIKEPSLLYDKESLPSICQHFFGDIFSYVTHKNKDLSLHFINIQQSNFTMEFEDAFIDAPFTIVNEIKTNDSASYMLIEGNELNKETSLLLIKIAFSNTYGQLEQALLSDFLNKKNLTKREVKSMIKGFDKVI